MSHDKPFIIDPGESFPNLPGAPIVEAIIQWRARARKEITQQALQELLKQRLPDYPDCKLQNEVQIRAEFSSDASSNSRKSTWLGFRLTSQDKRYVAQFVRDGLTLSRLTPYQNWDTFWQEAWRLWHIFLEVLEPADVQRLGVRFLNRIGIQNPDNVRDCLTSPPERLQQVGLPAVGFLYQSRHEVPGHPFQVNVSRTLQNPQPGQKEFGLIVDIDVFTTKPLSCEDHVQETHLKQMHWLKNKVFFSLMSEQAIEQFTKGTT